MSRLTKNRRGVRKINLPLSLCVLSSATSPQRCFFGCQWLWFEAVVEERSGCSRLVQSGVISIPHKINEYSCPTGDLLAVALQVLVYSIVHHLGFSRQDVLGLRGKGGWSVKELYCTFLGDVGLLQDFCRDPLPNSPSSTSKKMSNP